METWTKFQQQSSGALILTATLYYIVYAFVSRKITYYFIPSTLEIKNAIKRLKIFHILQS